MNLNDGGDRSEYLADTKARTSNPTTGSSQELPGSRPQFQRAQIAVLQKYGSEHDVAVDQILFSDGDVEYDLIVVLSGELEVVEHHGQAGSNVVSTYRAFEFPGEIGMLTGQHAYLTARVTKSGRILHLSPSQVRSVMAQEPDLSETILRTFLLRHARLTRRGTGIVLVGSRFDASTRSVLARNRISSRWVDLEDSSEAETVLLESDVPVEDLPIVIVPGGPLLRKPTQRQLFEALGLSVESDTESVEVCDVGVVGAGPGGLAASVYGASEGLSTTLAEGRSLGGQAGTSSRIENYLGFPAGLSGEELATRSSLQAQKFGVRIKLGSLARSLTPVSEGYQVGFDTGEAVVAKSVIIATGGSYRRLALDRLSDFEGVGIYYAATQMEAQACRGGPVVIIGGGNSAGQAALFLARHGIEVHLAIRGTSLVDSMSRYLITQIEHDPLVQVLVRTEITALLGEDYLEAVELFDRVRGEKLTRQVCGVFVFIGAAPCVDWLNGSLAQDDHGFLLTGSDIPKSSLQGEDYQPLPLETNLPGVFAVGDVRSRSVKRVATAIGEGSMAVRLVFDRIEGGDR
jgi:thioredoxin reductase (NADPH)